MELCMYTVQMLCPGRRIMAPWVTLAEGLTLNSCAQRYLNRLEETYWSRDRGLWQTESLRGTGCPSSLSCRHKTWAQPWVTEGQVGRMHLGGETQSNIPLEDQVSIAWFSYSQPLWVTSPTLVLPPPVQAESLACNGLSTICPTVMTCPC